MRPASGNDQSASANGAAVNGAAANGTKTSKTKILDPEGDVTLTVNDTDSDRTRRFQVSSRILSLASPVFSKMLGPNFKEGNQLRNNGHVSINIEEDDPDAMEIVLSALHFCLPAAASQLGERMLIQTALACDKYDCSQAMSPWVRQWCKVAKERRVVNAGYTFLAAYLFRAHDFRKISAEIAMHMPRKFELIWKEIDGMIALAGDVMTAMVTMVGRAFFELHQLVQYVYRTLRSMIGCYGIDGAPKFLCVGCEHRMVSLHEMCPNLLGIRV